jgi:hypothetical protein
MPTRLRPLLFALAIVLALFATLRLATGAPPDWPVLPERFESTGGGGWWIEGYRPARIGGWCITAFSAVSPEGARFENGALFDATPVAGGVMCSNGRWRAADGSGEGTTPLRFFLGEDGVARRAPE